MLFFIILLINKPLMLVYLETFDAHQSNHRNQGKSGRTRRARRSNERKVPSVLIMGSLQTFRAMGSVKIDTVVVVSDLQLHQKCRATAQCTTIVRL